jgi:REP element-mobilizing transposase RayT
LKGYDYSQDGAYIVTIYTHSRECLFGKIVDGETRKNECGKIAECCWLEIQQHYPNVSLDEFVIMPNHVYGIIILNDVGVQNFEPLLNLYPFCLLLE